MNTVKSIAYFGADPDFVKELDTFIELNGVGEFNFQKGKYSKGKILECLKLHSPNIIYLDFTLVEDLEALYEEILFTKTNCFFKSVLFVGVFANKESYLEHRFLLSSGIHLFFIKGSESASLHRDAFYIAFEDSMDFPAFARVRKINKPLKAGMCSTLISLDDKILSIESDLESPEDSLALKIPLFPDLSCPSYQIKEISSSALKFPMLTSYKIEIPVIGPWDDISLEKIQEDTFETWKDNNQELLKEAPVKIKVFTKNIDLAGEIFPYYDSSKVHLTFHDELNVEELSQDLSEGEYPIIFFDLEVNISEEGGLEKLLDLCQTLNRLQTSKSIVISTRNPSKTQAIQKLLCYESILCYDKGLSGAVYNSLVVNFMSKKNLAKDKKFVFPINSASRAVDLDIEVELTSFTEHEITFYSPIPIPMFSLLHFKLPFELAATVVPSLIDLPNRSESRHYMAFITGINEEELELIRVFINQIIYKPLDDYGSESIDKLMASIVVKNHQSTPVLTLNESLKQNLEPEDATVGFQRTTKYDGKSKL